ncbi:ABC transporter permease [Anaeromicropila herbilytica]|uniref:ABC transporter permease n=1 Tax=Anaeromicropila herbilytica TaxID=2785025 RepID=A0A7R7IB83_9FIRM|nr:ABC transporter permease [Anaeromicropila herbilytica]BCN29257.1 hypothetical protein bsdtb5_05520 [Anaeromicropila herbilytica]
MSRLIRSEILKLKNTPFYKVLIGISIILPLIGTEINASSLKQSSWESFINQNLWISIMLVWLIYLLVLGCFLFIREKEERTIDNLFIIPIGRIELVIAKLVVLFLFTLMITTLSYVTNLFYLILGFSVDGKEFVLGFVKYISGGILMFGALLLVYGMIHLFNVKYFGAFIISAVYLIISFVGMWNPYASSLLPSVAVLRIIGCGYQISYGYPFDISVYSYVLNVCINVVLLFLYGYKNNK